VDVIDGQVRLGAIREALPASITVTGKDAPPEGLIARKLGASLL
jgi:hypothetical protein